MTKFFLNSIHQQDSRTVVQKARNYIENATVAIEEAKTILGYLTKFETKDHGQKELCISKAKLIAAESRSNNKEAAAEFVKVKVAISSVAPLLSYREYNAVDASVSNLRVILNRMIENLAENIKVKDRLLHSASTSDINGAGSSDLASSLAELVNKTSFDDSSVRGLKEDAADLHSSEFLNLERTLDEATKYNSFISKMQDLDKYNPDKAEVQSFEAKKNFRVLRKPLLIISSAQLSKANLDRFGYNYSMLSEFIAIIEDQLVLAIKREYLELPNKFGVTDKEEKIVSILESLRSNRRVSFVDALGESKFFFSKYRRDHCFKWLINEDDFARLQTLNVSQISFPFDNTEQLSKLLSEEPDVHFNDTSDNPTPKPAPKATQNKSQVLQEKLKAEYEAELKQLFDEVDSKIEALNSSPVMKERESLGKKITESRNLIGKLNGLILFNSKKNTAEAKLAISVYKKRLIEVEAEIKESQARIKAMDSSEQVTQNIRDLLSSKKDIEKRLKEQYREKSIELHRK